MKYLQSYIKNLKLKNTKKTEYKTVTNGMGKRYITKCKHLKYGRMLVGHPSCDKCEFLLQKSETYVICKKDAPTLFKIIKIKLKALFSLK